MEIESTSAPASTESTGIEASQASPTVSETPVEASNSPAIESATPAPAYTPNFKFKAAGQEYELDEEYRGYVKTPEDEKRIKRLMEQAKALDSVRNERETYKSKASEVEKELGYYNNGLAQIKELRSKGDVRKALEMLGLSKDEVYKAAKQFLDFDALPQTAQDIYYQSQESERQRQMLESQNSSYISQMQALQVSVRRTELSQAMSNPEVKDIQTKFDAQFGEGAFQQEVINAGQSHHALTQQDLTANDAVNSVVRKLKPFMQMNQPAQVQVEAQVTGPKEVPVIPSAKGAAQSSASKGITSLDDLMKVRKEKYGY